MDTVSPADEHRVIAAGFTDRVRGARPDASDDPAPCEGWVARDVVRHLVEWFPAFLRSGAGVELLAPTSRPGCWRSSGARSDGAPVTERARRTTKSSEH